VEEAAKHKVRRPYVRRKAPGDRVSVPRLSTCLVVPPVSAWVQARGGCGKGCG
jgi:hypothetical protein